MGATVLGLALCVVSGCKNTRSNTNSPDAPRTVVAEPGAAEHVYVERSYRYDAPPAAYPEAVGYEELSDGQQVVVVEYVHTYPDAIETFPQVTWSGRTYYNVHGDFVYWANDWGWCYYLGPPAPLVVFWNGFYPWAPYAFGVGYYGPGWYWGGVGSYGYHAYGLPVAHQHHHHHGYYADQRRPGRDPRPSSPSSVPSRGGPTGDVNPGAPVDPARRKKTATRRNPTPSTDTAPSRRNPGSGKGASPARRRNPSELATGPVASRRNPAAPAPKRTNSYTTATGQRVTVIDPRGAERSPAIRRRPKTIGRTPPQFGSSPRRTRGDAAGRAPNNFGTAGGPKRAATSPPSRANPKAGRSKPKQAPSWGPRYSNTPKQRSRPSKASPRTTPRRSAPSRGPSRSAPSRTYRAPSRSAPSRSAPSRSAPSRSAPSRSAPSRSAPSRSAPSRSAPARRSAPSRSAPRRSNPRKR